MVKSKEIKAKDVRYAKMPPHGNFDDPCNAHSRRGALRAFLCSMITHFDYTKFTPGDGYMECLKMQCFEMDMPKMVMNKMAEKQFEGLWPLVEFQTRGFIPPPPF